MLILLHQNPAGNHDSVISISKDNNEGEADLYCCLMSSQFPSIHLSSPHQPFIKPFLLHWKDNLVFFLPLKYVS